MIGAPYNMTMITRKLFFDNLFSLAIKVITNVELNKTCIENKKIFYKMANDYPFV